ncbi:hypothetical protein F5144DRAFT_621234 [Chaetomium tenue]|uniref:Uncharacterized protein n=1 Tax=Chaetomium tenue TaxID=1854479 RepID=A0ACB7PC85_9PEZI|nr:hypothetical protein F5144DRAFT_621234 [Chaetomium globosum]
MLSSTFTNKVTITHIGTATATLDIDGITFLTDPFFSPAGTTFQSSNHTLHTYENPALRLDQLPPIDAVLLSHENHPDNLDELGRQLLDGRRAQPRAPARHARLRRLAGARGTHRRQACVGFVVHTADFGVAPDGRLNAIYFSGDTVYRGDLAQVAEKYHVVVALVSLEKATLDGLEITMDGRQAARLFRDLKADALVPMHYESWDHFTQNGEGVFKEFEAEGPGKAVEIN